MTCLLEDEEDEKKHQNTMERSQMLLVAADGVQLDGLLLGGGDLAVLELGPHVVGPPQ